MNALSIRTKLVMLFSAASFFTSLPFVILGAWPIAGFMGADVALFYFAFRANYRAARAYDVEPFRTIFAVERATRGFVRGERREFAHAVAIQHGVLL